MVMEDLLLVVDQELVQVQDKVEMAVVALVLALELVQEALL